MREIRGACRPKAMTVGIYDGRYVYFVSCYDGYAPHGRVLRYDTQGGFTDSRIGLPATMREIRGG